MPDSETVFFGLHVEFHSEANGGQGHPLLFVHGAWSGSWIFENYLSYLPSAGWNCYAMDLRGHYKSDPTRLEGITQWDYARDVVRVAHRLPVPPVLIGFGTGAHIIQLALSKGFPAAGAVFISAKLPNIRKLKLPPEVQQMPALLPPEPIQPSPDIPPHTLKWLNEHISGAVEPRSTLIALLRGDVQTKPEFVTVPYLVVTGELDDTISLEEGTELSTFYQGRGALDIVRGVSHEGILVGTNWHDGADAINAWLFTSNFDKLSTVGNP